MNSGSSGRVARRGTLYFWAKCSPPPEENMSERWLQCGHTNPLIFSTIPDIFKSSWRQKSRHLRQSARDSSCGVVTTMAFFSPCKSWAAERDSSPVPGGKSRIRKSRSPQSVWLSSCSSTPILAGPRQITAESGFSIKTPSETNFTPWDSSGISPLTPCSMRIWLTWNSVGWDGPWKSTSKRPTLYSLAANRTASEAATVLFPTPPLPESTITLFFIRFCHSGTGGVWPHVAGLPPQLEQLCEHFSLIVVILWLYWQKVLFNISQ